MGYAEAEMGGKSRVGLALGIERALAALAPVWERWSFAI